MAPGIARRCHWLPWQESYPCSCYSGSQWPENHQSHPPHHKIYITTNTSSKVGRKAYKSNHYVMEKRIDMGPTNQLGLQISFVALVLPDFKSHDMRSRCWEPWELIEAPLIFLVGYFYIAIFLHACGCLWADFSTAYAV